MRRLLRAIVFGLSISFLISTPVFAYYYANLDVAESSGNSYTELPLIVSINTTDLLSSHFINDNGTDTRVATTSGQVLAHLLTDDKLLFVANITASTTTHLLFVTGQNATDFTFPIITGYGGYVTVPDNEGLEPGDGYVFCVAAYFNTSAGTDKNIIRKDDAIVFNVTDDEELTFAVTGVCMLTASSVESGWHTIMVYSDGSEIWMTIDDVEMDRTTTGVVPDEDSDWVLFENNVCPYVYYFGEWLIV